MFKAEIINHHATDRWNNLLLHSLYPSYRQSFTYEHLKQINGREITTFIFKLNGEDIAGMHYSIKRSKFNLLSTADILSGFVFKNEPTSDLIDFMIEHFVAFGKSKNVTYIRITPWLPKILAGKKTHYEQLLTKVLFRKGFDVINSGQHTYWIDLSLSDDELFKNMNSQTRRNIKKAQKVDFDIERIETFSEKKVKIFYDLYNSLGDRKNFDTLSKKRFFEDVEVLMNAGATLFFLKYMDIIINVGLATNFGIASFYHGAMNPEYKNLEGCPAPGHFMQWIMIKHMKNKELKIYDMAFCPGPEPVKEHPMFDMWRFKHGFGGDHVEFLPTYGKINKPVRGILFKLLKHF